MVKQKPERDSSAKKLQNVNTKRLQAYIADRSAISNLREMRSNSLHIRSIKLNIRKSTAAGGYHEWCFEDVANALEMSK